MYTEHTYTHPYSIHRTVYTVQCIAYKHEHINTRHTNTIAGIYIHIYNMYIFLYDCM